MTHLEQIATSSAAEILDAYEPTFPVDGRLIAESLGIVYCYRSFHPAIDGCAGVAPDGTRLVVINNHMSKPETRLRYTMLHEIAHHLIAEQVRFTTDFWLDAPRQRKTPLDRACDLFAAHVLIPEAMLREWWHELRGNKECRNAVICNRLGVSAVALDIRAKGLELR